MERLNGFFAFAIYDKVGQSLFIARDRFGIKPLLIYQDDEKLLFASEMKALFAYGIARCANMRAIYAYLQLSYLPPHVSAIKNVKKLRPGECMTINLGEKSAEIHTETHYRLKRESPLKMLAYEQAQKRLFALMNDAVRLRLIADVPLGIFLSGGMDSSIITALASTHVKQLNTFSIGFSDNPQYDETPYAQLVAKHYGTTHTVFKLSENELCEALHGVLDYLDEPFADSASLPLFLLCQQVRKHATVALSGDGGDELFAGYNKHRAEYRMLRGGVLVNLVKTAHPLWKILPKSRQGNWANRFRQLERFARAARSKPRNRYVEWASFMPAPQVAALFGLPIESIAYNEHIAPYLSHFNKNEANLTDTLYADTRLVLPGDMLVKTDLMSMANSLEVRVPFLDHRVADFAFQLPDGYKMNGKLNKRIVQDAFRHLLPSELYNRPKHGFEVPLLKWMRGEYRSKIFRNLLNRDYLEAQGVFDVAAVNLLNKKLMSSNPGDAALQMWALVAFQHWAQKYAIEFETE